MAPPEVGRDLAAALGARASYAEIPHCGHAILPEQPARVARHLVAFLRRH
jgi:pimeloyl-ACP methyl ester carboxylesterase